MVVVLLPGMDGTGALFRWFARLLPDEVERRIISYPVEKHLSYEVLADTVRGQLPRTEPYVIIAESYSGPLAILLAARPVGNLEAVVLVSTFAFQPFGRAARWTSRIAAGAWLRAMPGWILNWFLLNQTGSSEVISSLKGVVAAANPGVLAARLREVLTVDVRTSLAACQARIVCLYPGGDRVLGGRGLRSLLSARPYLEVVTIDGPHLLLQAAPEKCLAALGKLGVLASPPAARGLSRL